MKRNETRRKQADLPKLAAEEFFGLWSQSDSMRSIFRMTERVAKDDVAVLVRGETGTGKEGIAQATHQLSPRKARPFLAINCAAVPSELLESELFGHKKGAFTGAISDRKGLFEMAHGGSVLLDEVADMPLLLQAKLLRVLETQTVTPVGGSRSVPFDVRIISATHKSLREEAAQGRFRADLMYRLRVVPLFLPALRERKEDIPLLVSRFISAMNPVKRRKIREVEKKAMLALTHYSWPGNVRELKNALSYAFALGEGALLKVGDLPLEIVDLSVQRREGTLSQTDRFLSQSISMRDHREKREIEKALEKTKGKRDEAAELLGISRVTLWRKIRALGLDQMAEDDFSI